ncbi:hypothetical protein BV25DRAFT_1820163 [Artomyces pyxidatus]|uniref:Uncharacterized protein n=1 Tax=Artomyces pyxidatus TaxID=48021 RepID=A0ACB8TEY7_9AGAM|nr:hypothetical protein BV25DRAFT_1820163 [Artomyces pyxidatus]
MAQMKSTNDSDQALVITASAVLCKGCHPEPVQRTATATHLPPRQHISRHRSYDRQDERQLAGAASVDHLEM